MLNKVWHFYLSVSSLFPVLFSFWFKEFSEDFNYRDGVFYLISFVILLMGLKFLLYLAERTLETWSGSSLKIVEISKRNGIDLIFVLIYLIPLFYINDYVLLFLLLLFSVFVFYLNKHYSNPLLYIMGYRQYKIKLASGLTMVLITKKQLTNSEQIGEVVQLTKFLLLEKNSK